MGMRFDLQTANWVASILDRRTPDDCIQYEGDAEERMQIFLATLEYRYYSSPVNEGTIERVAKRLSGELHRSKDKAATMKSIVRQLRELFGTIPWLALIVPSGAKNETALDRELCSIDFLRGLVSLSPGFRGFILQLVEPPERMLALTDIFPAFQRALARSSDWPGLLVWSRDGAEFFPFKSRKLGEIRKRASWLVQALYDSPLAKPLNFAGIIANYRTRFSLGDDTRSKLHLLQISDIHLGSEEAGERLPRTQFLISKLIDELDDGTVVPIVTGDLMDSPRRRNRDAVRAFFAFLDGLVYAKNYVRSPLRILGNHDVRKHGWQRRLLGDAIQMQMNHGVTWFDEYRVCLACFNSVVGGHLARGEVGQRQWIDISNEIDSKKNSREYAVVGVLHHHPVDVNVPSWIAREFYEKAFGRSIEKTDILKDAETFVHLAESRQMVAILHGHKHIPCLNRTPRLQIPVFGCGSSIGKVKTKQSWETCISFNVITLDRQNNHLNGTVMAEREIGGGLQYLERHAMIYRSEINWSNHPAEQARPVAPQPTMTEHASFRHRPQGATGDDQLAGA
jgi:hypothetical protein